MYILKNAFANIFRNKGRNILMGIIIFAILLTSAVSIIINQTTGTVIEDYKSRFGSEVYLYFDYASWQADRGSAEESTAPTLAQKISFSQSKYLLKSIFVAQMPYLPVNFKIDDGNGGGVIEGGSGGAATPGQRMIVGRDNVYEAKEFKSGERKLSQGTVYKEQNECMISNRVAELNDLKINDEIKIRSYYADKPMTATLKITGIFIDNAIADGVFGAMRPNRSSEILTNFKTATELEMFEAVQGTVDATYYLKNPDDLGKFQQELSEKGLSKYYRVTADEKGYRKVVAPVEGLAKITNTFLIVVLALGSVILIILSTLSIRERKYEIGVLRAMGMKKGKVAMGLLSEIIIITALCLGLGLGIGAAVAQPVADGLMAEQVRIADENYYTGGGTEFDANGNSALTEIDVKLSGAAVGYIIAIAFSLTIISSIGSILYVTKFEPMKILSERS